MTQTLQESFAAKNVSDLQQKVATMPLVDALKACRAILKPMTSEQRRELWQEINSRGAANQRLGGIICAAEQLRMPQHHLFGTPDMAPGDHLTDYDRVRSFILAARNQEGIRGKIAGNFYPEIRQLTPAQRIVALARAHVGCAPTGDKQANLFSLCGLHDKATVGVTTQPQGTTCANFARAVRISAGDSREIHKMLTVRPNMLSSIGLEQELENEKIKGKIKSPEFVPAIKSYLYPGLPEGEVPQAGDMYYVIIPGVLENNGKKDSGHVGIVVDASRSETQISMQTIDGGQKSDGVHGHWTTETAANGRVFTKGSKYWEMRTHAQVKYEYRVLVGWAKISVTSAYFEPDVFLFNDGGAFRARL